MTGRVVRDGLWWLTLAVAAGIFLASLPGYARGSLSPEGIQVLDSGGSMAVVLMLASWGGRILSLGAAGLCLVLAVLVYHRKPGERMAVVFSFYVILYGLLQVGPLEYFMAYWQPGYFTFILLLQVMLLPFATMFVLLIFPTGHFTPFWSRWLVFAGGVESVFAYLVLDSDDLLRGSSAGAGVYYVFLFVLFVVTVGVLIWRYLRLFSPAERQQTRWVFVGMAATFGLMLLFSIPYFGMLNAPPGSPLPWWTPLVSLGWWFALIIVPVAMTVAILRYRLLDIDVIIRRTLVYGGLSVSLAITYFVTVVVLQRLLQALTGRQSPLVIVLSTLLIAALFSPLRRRIQAWIDQRFYRTRFNAARTLSAFARTARDETDLQVLAAALQGTIEQTVQPETIGLWLRSPGEILGDASPGNEQRTPA